jgi:hypothetical protein
VFYFGRCIASGDVNGDGFSDIMIVGDSVIDPSNPDSAYRGKCWIYFGGVSFDTVSDVQLLNSEIKTFWSMHSVDINGDGLDDVVLGACNNVEGNGEIQIFLGDNVMDTACDFRIVGYQNGSVFGCAISSGDVNGDGYKDLIVGAYGAWPIPGGFYMGRVYIYYGGPNFDIIPDMILNGGHNNDQEGFGSDIGQCADVNNDGFDDVIVGAWDFGPGRGRLYIYFGGNPMDTIADVTMMGEGPNQHLGWDAIASLRNENNYDYATIGTCLWPYGFFAGYNPGKVYILFGGNLMDSIPDVWMIGRTDSSGLAHSLSRSGYIDIINNDDVVAGAPTEYNHRGTSYIWLSGTLFDTIPDAWLRGLQYNDGVGWEVTSAGDVDGDGRDEIIVDNVAASFYHRTVWVCKYTGVGIEEARGRKQEARNLKIYPNPAKSIIRVSCPWVVKEMKIYDVTGKIVKIIEVRGKKQEVETLKQVQGEIRWDLRDEKQKRVANGIYFVELTTDQVESRQNTEHRKIIREIRKIVITK